MLKTPLKRTVFCFFLQIALGCFFCTSLKQGVPINAFTPEWSDQSVIIAKDSVFLSLEIRENGNRLHEKEVTWYRVEKEVPADLKTIYIYEYPALEDKPHIKINYYEPNGIERKIPSTHIVRTPAIRFENDLFRHADNTFLYTCVLPRYNRGMSINVTVERVYTHPEIISHVSLRKVWSAKERFIRLSWPHGCQIRYCLQNGESIPLDTSHGDSAGVGFYTVKAENVGRFSPSRLMKNPEQWYPLLFFSLPAKGVKSPTWQECGDHYLDMVSGAFAMDSAVENLAVSIKKAAPHDRIAASFEAVKNRIRYYGNFEELHGYIPRSPGDVLRNGYGDCKEMAFLLTLVLRQLGIRAYPAIVSTFGYFQAIDDVPSIGVGNHAVTCVESADGSFSFFDPTIKDAGVRESKYPLLYQRAFIIKKEGSLLTSIIPENKCVSSLTTESAISKDSASGSWVIAGAVRCTGPMAFSWYRALNGERQTDRNAFVQRELLGFLKVDATEDSVVYLARDSIFIRYKASFEKNVITSGKKAMVLSVPGIVKTSADEYDLEPRLGPLFVEGFRQHDFWDIPPGFTELDGVVKNDGFWKGIWKKSGKRVERTVAMETQSIDKESRARFNGSMKERGLFAQQMVWEK
jgi:hypothetical protein